MTRAETNKFKQILETKKNELALALRNRGAIVIEATADAVDAVQHATERDMAIRNLDMDTALLRQVQDALDRVNEGSYGVCLSCEEEINPKRLNAVPWACYCISCQELADNGNGIPINMGDLATA